MLSIKSGVSNKIEITLVPVIAHAFIFISSYGFELLTLFNLYLHFFIWLWITITLPFISTWKTPFSILCRAGLVIMNSLRVFSGGGVGLWGCFNFTLIFERQFGVYRILYWQVLPPPQHFEYINPLPSGLQGFWWETGW